jgi:DNA-binding SARP family transcriptional activator
VPLLIAARDRGLRLAYVTRLLAEIGLPDIQIHPGYQLRVQTLGGFRAWRGQSAASEIKPRAWQRDKARQLFQLLLTHRRRWLQREEIVELLWPDLSPEAAGRDFKVALNALNRAIEPARSSDAPFAFIAREGTAYRLRPEADVWLDAAAFEQGCETGLRFVKHDMTDEGIAHLRSGLRLYHGDYLPEALYEDWASEERERLLSLYLRAADRLAEVLLEQGQYDEAIQWCERILTRDACWESAYRTIMSALAQQGNRPQAFRVYQRCVNALREELDVAPSPATIALHERIVRSDGAVL